MVTPIEIIDTAVKIGLGALISGVTAYLIARLNHNREMEKARAIRRRELLETIAEQVETFTHVVLKYWALTEERAVYERDDRPMPEDRQSEWKEAYSAIPGIFKEMTSAEAKLLLLGEKEAQRLLRDYGDYVGEFKATTFAAGRKLSKSVMQDHRANILNKRAALFQSLSAIYKRQHA
jgi:hypothetical protein